VTRGRLPQRAGSLDLNGGGAAAAVPPTNDSLTQSGTGCFTAVPVATVGVKGLRYSTNSENAHRFQMLHIRHTQWKYKHTPHISTACNFITLTI